MLERKNKRNKDNSCVCFLFYGTINVNRWSILKIKQNDIWGKADEVLWKVKKEVKQSVSY